jgi:putative transposase
VGPVQTALISVRSKTVTAEVGPVEIDVPWDRDSTFEPRIVAKRQRRLGGVDEMVLSLSAKGLTHGEISAHLAEVYGASVSKQTISTITDKVLEGMAEWQNRPLDSVYPVIFLDAISVKIREGSVCNLRSISPWRSPVREPETFSGCGPATAVRDVGLPQVRFDP